MYKMKDPLPIDEIKTIVETYPLNTVKENLQLAQDTREYTNKTFCPLINGYCYPDCVCFVSARFENVRHQRLDRLSPLIARRCVPAYCSNGMFGGE